MSVRKKILIAVLVAVVLGGAIFGIVKLVTMGSSAASGDSAVYVRPVSEISGKGLFGQINRYAGTVESPESWSYSLRAGGKVDEVYVRVGDTVMRGQKLLSYDTTEEKSNMEEAEIELERMEGEIEKIEKNIGILEKAIGKAKGDDKPPLQIELENEKLELKKAKMQVTSKKKEIENLKSFTGSPVVTSKMDGVITSINNGSNSGYGDEDSGNGAFLTVVKVGDYRIKASANEMNVGELAEGAPILVSSRVDDKAWYGVIDSIERDHPESNLDRGTESASYPFFISLEDCDGLMLGQHVYVELDLGQRDGGERTGIWISDKYIMDIETASPYVFVDNGQGLLERRTVALGERDAMLSLSQISAGLALTDRIALPNLYVKEGMPTTTDASALQNQGGVTPTASPTQSETVGFGGEGIEGEGFAGAGSRAESEAMGFGDPAVSGGFGYGSYEDDNGALAMAGGDEI